MDVTELIRGVRAREPLWDRKHKFYHDRSVTMAHWDEVALIVGVDSETARTKWKGLRDTFRGELRKLHKTVLIGKPRTSTNWEYFEEMMFVKDQIYSNKRHLDELVSKKRKSPQPRAIPENLASDSPKVPVKEEPDLATRPESPVDETHAAQRRVLLEGSPQVKRVKLNDPMDVFNEIKKEKALDDDDFNFLMSLLPQMRCLPTTQNLFVRMKIQELLYKEMVSPRTDNELRSNYGQ